MKETSLNRRTPERIAALRLTTFGLIIASLAIIGVACGSSGDTDPAFSKIQQLDDRVVSITNFEGNRFKRVKEYDVSELPDASAAYLVYFTPSDSEPVQFEIRVYPDFETVMRSGVGYAAEVTGEDAMLRSADVRWDVGTKDRRGGGAFRGQLTPLYGDYAVVGNVIMLCEGRDSAQALERCAALLVAARITDED
ncbi:MAG: DUF6810 family protein [Dehalococcoidia bacterium]